MNMLPQQMAAAMPMDGSPDPDTSRSYDRYLRWGTISLVGLLGALLLAMFMPIQGAVIAPGSIVVEGKPKVLQHLDGGIVGELFVRDGDAVTAGDVLVRLDTTALSANRDLLENRMVEAKALQARLLAERDNRASIPWDEVFPAHMRTPEVNKRIDDQTELFETRRRARLGQVSQLESRILQQADQITGLRSIIRSREQQLVLINKQLAGQQILVDKGVIKEAYSTILQLEREQASLQGEIASYKSDIARTRNAIGETEIEILQSQRTFQESVLTELRSTESQVSDLREQLVTAQDQTNRIDIIAPVDGIVHNMTLATIGGVVTPAEPMMEIIPTNASLIVEARVSPNNIDQVYVGQDTTVRLSAFNTRTTPELDGIVISTSANTVVDQMTGMPYYIAKVEIPPDQIARLNGQVLVPGMPAEAFMQTDSRSIWNYLIKPASDQLVHAFREE